MNYIQEMNAFYEDVEAAGLSSKEINLFNALLHINNKARWKKVFTVRPSYLTTLTGQAKSTNERARKELVEKGYIKFEKGSGGKMARYQIIQSADRNRPEAVPEKEESEEEVHEVELEEESIDNPEAIEENDSQKEESDESNPHSFYQNNFGTLSPFLAENISQWCEDMSDELVIASMKTALRNNKKTFGYCEAILKDWQAKGISTIEDARAEQRAFQSQRKFDNVTPIRSQPQGDSGEYDYGF